MLNRIKSNKFLLLALVLIFALALGVRVGIIINTYGVSAHGGEPAALGDTARNLVEGRGYVIDEEYVETIANLQVETLILVDIQDVPHPEDEKFIPYYIYPPGTSILLAGTYWLFGEYRFIYVRVIQAIIDSFGCLLMFLIGKELFNRKIGVIAASLYAIFLPIAYLSTLPTRDALMPFMVLLSLYFFIKGVRRQAVKFYILSALSVGISCYLQPSTQLLPLFFGLGLFIYNLRRLNFRGNIINAAKVTAIMMAVLILVISPWIARNYRATDGTVVSMRQGLWLGMWEGFGDFGDNPAGTVTNLYEWPKEELGYDIKRGTPEYDAFFKEKVLTTIKEYPGWWLSVLARRIPRTIVYFNHVGLNYYPRDEDGNLLKDEYLSQNPKLGEYIPSITSGTFEAFRRNPPYSILYWGLVALFAIVPVLLSMAGIWFMRRNWRPLILVVTVPIYFSVLHVLLAASTMMGKSLLPGSLAYIIFSAIALDYIYSRIKGRSAESIMAQMYHPIDLAVSTEQPGFKKPMRGKDRVA